MTIAFTPRKDSISSLVYARQKAEGGIYCYFSTPKYCMSLEELLDHAECNHSLVKEIKRKSWNGGQFKSALLKHASDLRIHSLAILRRLDYLYPIQTIVEMGFTKEQYQAVKKQANRTYRMKT